MLDVAEVLARKNSFDAWTQEDLVRAHVERDVILESFAQVHIHHALAGAAHARDNAAVAGHVLREVNVFPGLARNASSYQPKLLDAGDVLPVCAVQTHLRQILVLQAKPSQQLLVLHLRHRVALNSSDVQRAVQLSQLESLLVVLPDTLLYVREVELLEVLMLHQGTDEAIAIRPNQADSMVPQKRRESYRQFLELRCWSSLWRSFPGGDNTS